MQRWSVAQNATEQGATFCPLPCPQRLSDLSKMACLLVHEHERAMRDRCASLSGVVWHGHTPDVPSALDAGLISLLWREKQGRVPVCIETRCGAWSQQRCSCGIGCVASLAEFLSRLAACSLA